jgi:hypothetical protein
MLAMGADRPPWRYAQRLSLWAAEAIAVHASIPSVEAFCHCARRNSLLPW